MIVLVGIFVLGNHSSKSGSSQSSTAPAINGIECQTEMVKVHWHAHLTMINDGQNVEVPAGIGINKDANCLYWLHTHQTDGIIHIESPERTNFTLGDFFAVWGQPLSTTEAGAISAASGQTLRFYVNGQPYPGDPQQLPLNQHDVITVESGQVVAPPPYTFPADL